MSGRAEDLVDETLPAWAGRSAEAPLDLLRRLAALDEDEAEALTFAHPRLLKQDTLALLATEAESESERAALARVVRYREAVEQAPRAYPVGFGPVERLWRHVYAGAIRVADAELLAADPCVAGQLFDLYLAALGRWSVGNANERNAWQVSLSEARVLYAAAQASPEAGRAECVSRAGDIYVECAKVALCKEPDGRLYRRAVAVAESVVEVRRGLGEEALARGLSLLGRLKLDPYTAELSPAGYWDEYTLRFGRLLYRPVVDSPSTEDELEMPEPADALREASEHLRAAVELGAGPDQAMSAKALVQALWYRHEVIHDVELAEVEAAARRALEVISPDKDPDRRAFVEYVLRGGTHESHGDGLPASVDELVERHGRSRALVMAVNTIAAQRNPVEALAIVDSVRHVAIDHGDPELYERLLSAEYHAIGVGLAPDLTDASGSFDRRLRRLRRRARKERWPEDRLHAALVRLACRTQSEDREGQGLRLVVEVQESSSRLAREREEALACLAASLTFREACNLGAAGKLQPAMEWYADALGRHTDGGLMDMALLCLRRMAGMAEGDSQLSQYLLAYLGPHALPLEATFGASVAEVLQDLYYDTSANLVDRRSHPMTAVILHQLAKGLSFATAVARPGPLDLSEEDSLLDRIRATEGELGAVPEEPFLDEEQLLTAYVQEQETSEDSGPGSRLANLQRGFDRRLVWQLYDERANNSGAFLSEAALRSVLDDRTVLVSLYLGGTPQGPAVHAIAMTRQETMATVIRYLKDMPIRTLLVGGENDPRFHLHPMAFVVAGLRGEVVEKPDFRLVDRKAEQYLATQLPQFFGHIAEQLPHWRAQGKDHLCVWPHGPLHYLPFHLFHDGGHPLAEDWVVTTLPALTLLGHIPLLRREGGPRLLSVGCADAGLAHGLPSVPEMPAQATDVAQVLGGTLLTEDDATPERFFAELPGATHVHIATHGAHNVNAPAFQCLYLHAADGRDGRVFANDLIRRDLSKIELVTLSACQTALGRFDVGDNLRGLPAALLLAGCQTIIATLWPVEPEPASTFFTTLYERIGAGRNKLDAFHAAQSHTRELHPHYCDWGAFTFIGDWRDLDLLSAVHQLGTDWLTHGVNLT